MNEDPLITQVRCDLGELEISTSLEHLATLRVLITGSSGTLGRYFTLAMSLMQIESGYAPSVVAVSRDDVPVFEALSIRNIRKVDAKPAILSGGFDVVIHAASPAHASAFMAEPQSCFEVNVTWADELARAGLESGTRFVYLSSGEVYGTNPPVPTAETDFGGLDPVDPRNIYAVSKRAGEALLSSRVLSQNLDLRICRLFHTFGPGVRRGEPRIFGALVDAALDRRDCTIIGNVELTRCFLYSFDALNGIAYAIQKLLPGAVVNVSGDEVYTIREAAQLAMSAMTQGTCGVHWDAEPRDVTRISSQIVRNDPDNGLLRATGWSPQVHLEEGFIRTLNSFGPKG